MFEILFYQDKHGTSEAESFIKQLQREAETDKDSKVNFRKVIAYINMLGEMGTRIGVPVTKHLDGEIWELRPLRNRIRYAFYKDNTFILLHHFVKKTQKTPKCEIEKAKRNLEDFRVRVNYGKDMDRSQK